MKLNKKQFIVFWTAGILVSFFIVFIDSLEDTIRFSIACCIIGSLFVFSFGRKP